MINRLGDSSTPLSSEAADPTRVLVAHIMLRKPRVSFECDDGGNIRFKFPLDGIGIAKFSLPNAKLMRTHWFANAVGEYIVRINLGQLDEVVRRADYPDLARKLTHTNFGLIFNPRYLQFQFHCSLLNRLFNEGLKRELHGVAA